MKLVHHKDTAAGGPSGQPATCPGLASAQCFPRNGAVTSAERHTPLAQKPLHLASGKEGRANPKPSAKLGANVPREGSSRRREGERGWKLTSRRPSRPSALVISSRKHLNSIDGTKCLARW